MNVGCKVCGGSGLVWASGTLKLWIDNYVLPGIESSTTPPDQWRDQICECSEDDPGLRRGARASKRRASDKLTETGMGDLFE